MRTATRGCSRLPSAVEERATCVLPAETGAAKTHTPPRLTSPQDAGASDSSEAEEDDDDDVFGSEDEELFDDDEEEEEEGGGGGAATSGVGGTALDGGEDSDSDDSLASVASFKDGFDSDFVGDAEDRAKLDAMPTFMRAAEIEDRRVARAQGQALVAARRATVTQKRRARGLAVGGDSSGEEDVVGRPSRRRSSAARHAAAVAAESSGSEEEGEWTAQSKKKIRSRQNAVKRRKHKFKQLTEDWMEEGEEGEEEGGEGGAYHGAGGVDSAEEEAIRQELRATAHEDLSDDEQQRRRGEAARAREPLHEGVLVAHGLLRRAWVVEHCQWDFFKTVTPGMFVRVRDPKASSSSGYVLGIVQRVVAGQREYTVKDAAGRAFQMRRRFEVVVPEVGLSPRLVKLDTISNMDLPPKYAGAPALQRNQARARMVRSELKALHAAAEAAGLPIPTASEVRARREALVQAQKSHSASAEEVQRSARAARLGADLATVENLTDLRQHLQNDAAKLREVLQRDHGLTFPPGTIMPLPAAHPLRSARTPEARTALQLHGELSRVEGKLAAANREKERRKAVDQAARSHHARIARAKQREIREAQAAYNKQQARLKRSKEYREARAKDPTVRVDTDPTQLWDTRDSSVMKAELQQAKIAAAAPSGEKTADTPVAAASPAAASGDALGLTDTGASGSATKASFAHAASTASRVLAQGATSRTVPAAPPTAAGASALQTLLAKLPEAGVPAAAAAPAQSPASGKPRLSFAQFKARHSKAAANAS